MTFVHDLGNEAPGHDLSHEHARQGFARRPAAVKVATIVDDVVPPELLVADLPLGGE
jgi:hypothetical protein